MQDSIFIQHRFTFEENGVKYTDAIVLPENEYRSLDAEQINTMKQDRFNAWKTKVNTPPEEVELSKKQVQAKIADANKIINEYQQKKEALQVLELTAKEEVVNIPEEI